VSLRSLSAPHPTMPRNRHQFHRYDSWTQTALTPNPSFKPSPNSKPPGRRYSAGLHFLQRRPGVSLLVPA
jgi:hypothetical protein